MTLDDTPLQRNSSSPAACSCSWVLSREHPSPCLRLCLQGNPDQEEPQGFLGIGGTTGEDTEAQKEDVIHTESPRSQRQSWDGGPSFGALHPSGHAEGARQQLPYTVSQQTLMEALGQAPHLKCSRPRPCPPGAPSRMGRKTG